MSKDLQEILNEVQEAIGVYRSLPKRKRLKRKNWKAYKDLIRTEMALIVVMNFIWNKKRQKPEIKEIK